MNIIKLQGDTEKRNGIYYEYDVDATPLGEGGMGRVFKGYRVTERTGERMPVAIKAIYENIPQRVVERARREANIQLDNDNLIRMYGFVETTTRTEDGKCTVHYHVIMELLIGVTLENIINGVTCDQNGMQIPFAAEVCNQYNQDRKTAVIKIMKAILSGLMALHDKGYIHRDIDPSNVMITIDGKIKLIDFGICKQIISLESLDKALTATGVFMGKVNYAAPELVLGDVKSQNYTTDIYALGILLYQLCTGHLPFSGTDQDILSANLRKPLPMKDIHGKEFKKIIRKATDKNQSKRYASVAQLRVDLEQVSTRQKKQNKKTPLITLAATITILLAATTPARTRPAGGTTHQPANLPQSTIPHKPKRQHTTTKTRKTNAPDISPGQPVHTRKAQILPHPNQFPRPRRSQRSIRTATKHGTRLHKQHSHVRIRPHPLKRKPLLQRPHHKTIPAQHQHRPGRSKQMAI